MSGGHQKNRAAHTSAAPTIVCQPSTRLRATVPSAIIAASSDQPTKKPGTVSSSVRNGKRRRSTRAAAATPDSTSEYSSASRFQL